MGHNLTNTLLGSARSFAVAALLLAAAALSAAALFSPGTSRLALAGAAVLLYLALNGLVALWGRRAAAIAGAALGWAAGLALLLPALWMLAASLRPAGMPPPTALAGWPVAPSLDGYARLLALLPVARYLANSLWISSLGVTLALLVASAAGFALVHCAPPLRRALLVGSVVGLALPPLTLWLGRFMIFRWLQLLDTPLALLAPALVGGSPLSALVFYAAFRRISPEQWDQARLDGAGPARIWLQIALPQARGAAIALGALVFCLFWGAYAEPLFFLAGDRWRTMPVAIQALLPLARSDWSTLMAGALVTSLPPLLILIAARRALLDEPAALLRKAPN